MSTGSCRTTDPTTIRADVAKCPAMNHHGLACPMRLACSRYTRISDGEQQVWLTVGPFSGRAHGKRVEFWCDQYENNGRDINEATKLGFSHA